MEARDKNESREARAARRRGGRWWWLLALPPLLLLAAWLTVPAWGPALAGRYLPDGWTLEEADLDLPGLRRATLSHARAEGRLGRLRLAVRVDGAAIAYAEPAAHIERLGIVLDLDDPATHDTDAPRAADRFTLPRLVVPGGYPRLTIDTLDLTLLDGDSSRTWQFSDLLFDGTEPAGELALRIDDPPFLTRPVQLRVALAPERLVLEATLHDAATPLLRFVQQVVEPAPGARAADAVTVTADLSLALPLSTVDTADLATLLAQAGLPPLTTATGDILVDARFAGDERLAPLSARVVADDVRLQGEAAGLSSDFLAELRREGTAWRLTLPAAEAGLNGSWPALPRHLEAALGAAGFATTLGEAIELALRIEGGAPDAPGLEAWIESAAPHSARVESQLRVSGALGADTTFDLHVEGLVLTLEDVAQPGAFALAADLETRLGLAAPLTLSAEPLQLGATRTELRVRGRLERSAPGALTFAGRLDDTTLLDFSLAHPANTVRLGQLTMDGDIAWAPDGFRWNGRAEGARMITAPGDAVAANSLMTADAFRFDGSAGGVPEAMTVSGKGRLDGVWLPDLAVTFDGVDIDLGRLDLPAVDAQLGILTTGLEATLDDTVHAGLDLDVTATLTNGEQLAGDGELLLGFTGALPFRFDARLDTAEATVVLDQASLPATALADAARAAAVTLPKSLRFTDGALAFDGTLLMGPQGLGGSVDVRGDALAFRLGESRFEGLEFSTRVAIADVISGDGPLLLELAQLAAGLDLVSVSTSLAFSGADLGLIDLDARLLGGSLSSASLRISGGDLDASLISWEGFDLGLLLTFLDVDGLAGEGTLDATIPLVSEGGQPGIDGARFAARGPGRLRYSAGGPVGNIGLQALENFEYEELEGTLDYEPDGDYTISLALLGRNPDLYDGYPIRFRLNLGGAMPALFRSLFVTGNFEEAIIDRLRAGTPLLEEGAGEPQGSDEPAGQEGAAEDG